MRLLVLADEPPLGDPRELAGRGGVEPVATLGDLSAAIVAGGIQDVHIRGARTVDLRR